MEFPPLLSLFLFLTLCFSLIYGMEKRRRGRLYRAGLGFGVNGSEIEMATTVTSVGYYYYCPRRHTFNTSPSSTSASSRRQRLSWRNFRCSFSSSSSSSSTTITPSSSSPLDGSSASRLDCVIVGAGITGLTIAQALSATNLLVTEAREREGGNITTVERDGYLWEEGPNSFQPSDPMLSLVVDSGLKDDLVLGDPKAPRFLFWEGNLRAVPSSPADLPFFDSMSFPGKLRAAFGALGFRPSPPWLISSKLEQCDNTPQACGNFTLLI